MIKIYECKRCHYQSEYKQVLKNHLEKKKECEIIYENIDRCILIDELKQKEKKEKIKYKCNKCDKEFVNRQNKWKHEKICKVESAKDDKIMMLVDKINELEKIIMNNKGNNVVNNTTNNTINNTINMSIDNLRPFGKENYDYVSSETLNRIISGNLMLLEFVKEIHFNIDHPENWNMYISNLRSNKAYAYNGKSFELEDKKELLYKLIKEKKIYFIKLLETLENILENERDIAMNELDYFDGDSAFKHHSDITISKTEDVAYNKREYVEHIKKEIDKKNKLDLQESISA